MRKLFVILSAVCFSFNGFTQKLKDKLEFKVTYELTYRLDSTNIKSEKSEFMVLLFGDKLSVFSSRAKAMVHSIVRNGNIAHTSRAAVTDFDYVLIKDRSADKIYYTLAIPDDHFFYLQAMDIFNWKITSERKEIKGYEAQKAITSLSGRDYVGWFTSEIPIPEGPYKFNGLPGLVLEIRDTRGEYIFTFVGLEKLSPLIPFRVNLNNYIEAERENLIERFYRYRKDPFTYMKAQGNNDVKIDPKVHKSYVESFTKMLEKENNPIELEDQLNF